MILFSWKWKVTLFEFVSDRWCNFCFCLRQIKLKILWPKLRWNLFFSPFRSWFESNKNSRKVFEVLCYLTLAWIQTRGVWQNSLLFWSPCGWAISNLSSTLLAFFFCLFLSWTFLTEMRCVRTQRPAGGVLWPSGTVHGLKQCLCGWNVSKSNIHMGNTALKSPVECFKVKKTIVHQSIHQKKSQFIWKIMYSRFYPLKIISKSKANTSSSCSKRPPHSSRSSYDPPSVRWVERWVASGRL